MNIFNALSGRHDKQLRERNLSAIFAYFLNPSRDHGLGDTFLKAFLEIIGIAGEIRQGEVSFAKTRIHAEEPLEYKKKPLYLDIVIEIVNSKSKILRYIVVENKTKSGSANTDQLNRYYNALIAGEDSDKYKNKITMVFLTPEQEDKKTEKEYGNFKELSKTDKNPKGDNKKSLRWTGAQSIQAMIRDDILKKEAEGEIPPINEYTKHTLKAFIMHLQKPMDLGDVRKSITCDIDDHEYTIEQYVGGAIRVYEDGKKCVAKNNLRHINKEEKLRVPETKNGIPKNTRQLGAQIINALKKKKKNSKPDG